MVVLRTSFLGLPLLALVLACSNESARTAPFATSADIELLTLSGTVLGPAGSICNSLPDGSLLLVRAIDPVSFSFAGFADLTCPENSYGFGLEPGSYLLRVELPGDPATLGEFPWRTIISQPVLLDGEDLVQDITVAPGVPLGGHVTFEGQPIEGVGLNLVYENAPGFGAAFGSSGTDGAWLEFFGRAPMVLQNGVRLTSVVGCGQPFGTFYLATRVVEGPPLGGFLFPDERDSIDCALETAPTVAFSHRRTPLVVTPMPGDIGGLSGELSEQFGAGWGVQLLGPGESPQHGSITFSQLFRGGLVVGVRPDVMLTGFGFGGYGDCGAACRDFGLDGRLSPSATRPSEKKKVTWRYSDASSPDAVGLEVVQRSYDGVPGAAYVLFEFVFTNASTSALTFYPGILMDWDVGNTDFDAFDDVGFTDRSGRLMYMTDAPGGPGTFDGTLVFGAPVAGNAVLASFGQTGTELVQLMTGDITIPSVTEPGDLRYMHTVGPISLRPHKRGGIWVAVVSGRDRTEFFANVDAASADVARRQVGPPENQGPDNRGVTASRAIRSLLPSADPRCKRGCEAQ
jgi:hypothetical protein